MLISHFWEILGVTSERTQGVILKSICKMKTVNVMFLIHTDAFYSLSYSKVRINLFNPRILNDLEKIILFFI